MNMPVPGPNRVTWDKPNNMLNFSRYLIQRADDRDGFLTIAFVSDSARHHFDDYEAPRPSEARYRVITLYGDSNNMTWEVIYEDEP